MDQTEGVQLLQQTACWVDKGQVGEHEIRMDVALHEVWRTQRKKQPKRMGRQGLHVEKQVQILYPRLDS